MRRLLAAFCLAVVLMEGCNKSKDTRLQIAVIPKGTTHEFWNSVKAGAEQAGRDLDVRAIWKGPLNENDRARQREIVEEFVADRVSGIVLAPLDKEALLGPVQSANQQHIPVVIIDSALDGQVGKDFVSFVATDNYKGGQMGGDELARLLNNKGKVVLLRYAVGSASTEEREKGFLDAIARHADLRVISSDRYGQATADTAKTAAMNMLDILREADGIFCPNESTAQGMVLALRSAGLAGKVKLVGFDPSTALVDALQKNEIDAIVAQDPYKIGYEGVKAIVQHIRGQTVPPRIDTGVRLVTRENLNSPEIQSLLKH